MSKYTVYVTREMHENGSISGVEAPSAADAEWVIFKHLEAGTLDKEIDWHDPQPNDMGELEVDSFLAEKEATE